MASSTLDALTAATASTGGFYYGTQSGADRKFTMTAAGASLAEAASATDQRAALGLGSIATQAASAVAITGGTFAGITGAGFRDTSAAFDVTQTFTSSTALTAGRSITWDVKNTSQSLLFTGASTVTFPVGTNTLLGSAVANTITTNGAASTPPLTFTGTWFTGGSSTTTKPQLLIEPAGATSTSWSTFGTGAGVNAASGFVGNLMDLQANGVARFTVDYLGKATFKLNSTLSIYPTSAAYCDIYTSSNTPVRFYANSASNGVNITAFTSGRVGLRNMSLTDDGASDVQIGNGTTGCKLAVYGTITDASNYVRASLAASSTLVTLAAETAGTGADNVDINITTAGTGLVNFATQSASADAALVSTHSARIKIGGTEYKMMLVTP